MTHPDHSDTPESFLLNLPSLDDRERERYAWQLPVPGFGEEGQRRLKAATVLISRVGGVGGTVAMHLAAAGVGRLVLAHAGLLRLDDLNRQMLMETAGVGRPRIESAARRLAEINPDVTVACLPENTSAENASRLVAGCDVVVSAAPLFTERLLLNREAVRQRKPMVDAAMYAMEARVTTFLPGRTGCLACLHPEPPERWQRRFPVFGAVAATAGAIAAVEVIKVLAEFGAPLADRLLMFDLTTIDVRVLSLARRRDCAVCGPTGSESMSTCDG